MHRAYSVDPDITVAATMPGAFYRDEAAFALVREKVFTRTWQWLGDTGDVAQPGSLSPREMLPGLLDEPLLLSRDAAGTLHCLSNVCTHRGNLLVTAPCRAQGIRCGYHARCFDLDGRMTASPGFEQARDFPSPADDLPVVPLAQFGPHAFAAIDPVAPLEVFLADLPQRLAWLEPERLRHDPSRDRDYHVQAHWALYVENCLEGFHIPFVHPGLGKTLSIDDYRSELSRYGSVQLAIARPGEAAFELPPESPDHGQRVAAYCYWLFPNLMLSFYPWGLSLTAVLPLGLDRTRIAFRAYVWNERQPPGGADAMLDRLEVENEAIVERVHAGVRSRCYRSGRYSPAHEQGVHHFHRLLCEFINA